MSVSYIKEKTKLILWGKSAGRCQYEGCNKQLYIDSLTKVEHNTAYIAHIVADKPTGPRGDEIRSDLLKKNINNLMLLCDEHHRLVDRVQIDEHPEKRLVEMKKKHEELMVRITDVTDKKESHVILYGANIGKHNAIITKDQAYKCMSEDFYPSSLGVLEIGLKNSSFTDDRESYWVFEQENLIKKFNQKIIPLTESNEIQNYSVFGLAPQPLLIKLGSLLYDINNVSVYTNQKEPKGWYWNKGEGIDKYFKLIKPIETKANIALVFSLSGTINDERITNVLGDDTSIWKITIKKPNNDFMKHRNHLAQFRVLCRKTLEEIKKLHGEKQIINVFPAMLPSTAIEFGRIRNPKADLPIVVYDENKSLGGFEKVLEINN